MKTSTIITAALLSALTLPVFAQTGAANATTTAPTAATAATATTAAAEKTTKTATSAKHKAVKVAKAEKDTGSKPATATAAGTPTASK